MDYPTTKKRFSPAVLPLLLVCGLTFGCQKTESAHQETNEGHKQQVTDEQPQEPEWTELLDKEHLPNWKKINFGGAENQTVEPNRISVEMGYPLTGLHYPDAELPTSNYELELDVRKEQGTDFFCCLTFPVGDSHCSFVVGGWGGTVTGISCIDQRDASDNPTTTVHKYNVGQWYHIRIKVTDDKVECWIDDEQVVDLTLGDLELSLRIEVEPCAPLGLCSFETAATWKGIRIRKLK